MKCKLNKEIVKSDLIICKNKLLKLFKNLFICSKYLSALVLYLTLSYFVSITCYNIVNDVSFSYSYILNLSFKDFFDDEFVIQKYIIIAGVSLLIVTGVLHLIKQFISFFFKYFDDCKKEKASFNLFFAKPLEYSYYLFASFVALGLLLVPIMLCFFIIIVLLLLVNH